MGKNLQAAFVNHDLRPAYFDQFHCLITDCQLSCCYSWRITFDRKDYVALKGIKGSPELNQRLSHGLRRIRRGPLSETMFGEFDMSSGICPLLREDHLCMLQLEKGAQAQPMVCKIFPRAEVVSNFGFLERSLSPACEGVLELLWNLPEGIDFVSDPLPLEKQGTVTQPEGHPYSISQCQQIRSACIDILQMRRFTLSQRILFMGLLLKELSDGETDIPRWLAKVQVLGEAPETLEHLQSFGSMQKPELKALANNLHVLGSVDMSTAELRNLRKEIQADLGLPVLNVSEKISISLVTPVGSSLSRYEAALARYNEQFREREYFMENLMVTIFFHLHLPNLASPESLWKDYVKFCNAYSFFKFMAVMSCREGATGDKKELFRLMVHTSRMLLHNQARQTGLVDELFKNESATLAHMAILLSI